MQEKKKQLLAACLMLLVASVLLALFVRTDDRPDSGGANVGVSQSPELAFGMTNAIDHPQKDIASAMPTMLDGGMQNQRQAESTYTVTVHVEDPDMAAVSGAEVWLADRWHSINDLRANQGASSRKTGIRGDVSFIVKPGRYFVHVWHSDCAPSVSAKHGSGEQMVLDVPSELSTRIRLLPVYVIAYQVSTENPPIAHTLKGSGFKALISDLDPLFASKCEEVRERIRTRFPSAEVSVFLFTGDRAKLGQWEAHALWAGRTCVKQQIIPVALREFERPIDVTAAGSAESTDFGGIMIMADGSSAPEFMGAAVEMKRVEVLPTDPFYLKVFTCKAKFGDVITLPVGSYEVSMPDHPFLQPALQASGRVMVTRGSWEARRIAFDRPMQWVVFDFKLPPGFLHRPFYGRVTAPADGTSISLMAHLPGEAKRWWLPTGRYTYEVHMATGNVMASELFAGGEFEAVAQRDGSDQMIPVDLSERMVEPAVPK